MHHPPVAPFDRLTEPSGGHAVRALVDPVARPAISAEAPEGSSQAESVQDGLVLFAGVRAPVRIQAIGPPRRGRDEDVQDEIGVVRTAIADGDVERLAAIGTLAVDRAV
jgi:hypothetical protein